MLARAATLASMGAVVFSQEIGRCTNIVVAILAPKFAALHAFFILFKCWRIEAHLFCADKYFFRRYFVMFIVEMTKFVCIAGPASLF